MKIEQPFNINYGIRVKLTEEGVKHFIAFYKNAPYHRVCTPEIDKDGYTKFPMWMLMKIYGSHMYLGNQKPPFGTNVFLEIEQNKQRMMKAVAFRVRIGELYWISWGEDGTQPTFTLDDMLGAIDRAHKFDSAESANKVAEIIDGEVVPVEEGEG